MATHFRTKQFFSISNCNLGRQKWQANADTTTSGPCNCSFLKDSTIHNLLGWELLRCETWMLVFFPFYVAQQQSINLFSHSFLKDSQSRLQLSQHYKFYNHNISHKKCVSTKNMYIFCHKGQECHCKHVSFVSLPNTPYHKHQMHIVNQKTDT